MPFRNLREYLAELKRQGELCEISAEVDPYLELAEIHRRVIDAQGPALLFTRVKGSPFPVTTNLFGTKKRVDLAFGGEIERLIARAAKLPHEFIPPTLAKVWQNRDLFLRGAKLGTKRQSHAPILQNVLTPPDLDRLPIITTWHEDGGPFITLPLVYTEEPETGVPNLGMYRMQRFSANSTGLHMQIGKGGGFHLTRAKELGRDLPVNVFLGGPPAMILAAIAPLPENVPELLLASFLLNEKLKMAENGNGTLPILAEAEFALVGYVRPDERQPEGPFGDHYGYYSLKHDYPVFRCRALYHRDNPIYPATVVGKPRQEDYFIGNYLQEMLSPLFPVVMPAVKDLWSYGETGYHSLAAAVVQERYKRETMASAFRILGEGQLSLTKFLLLLDQKIDLRDFRSVLEYLLARCDFRSDLFVFSNLSMDTLDYTGPMVNIGSKGVMIGVGDPIRELPSRFVGTVPRGVRDVQIFCRGCLVVEGPSFENDRTFPHVVATDPAFKDWPLVVVVDNVESTIKSEAAFLWTTFTRFEPAADIHARELYLERFHPVMEPPIVIDARMKPWYPAELECDDGTKRLVDERWSNYGCGS